MRFNSNREGTIRIGQRRRQDYVFQVNRDWGQKHPLWRLWIKRVIKVSWWPHEPQRLHLILFGRRLAPKE